MTYRTDNPLGCLRCAGVTFVEAVAEAIEGRLGPVKVRFIGEAAMARNKLASGRSIDLVDAQLLESDD